MRKAKLLWVNQPTNQLSVNAFIFQAYGLPTWGSSKGLPSVYQKPSVLPTSSSHSTLSPELLNILRQTQSDSMTRSSATPGSPPTTMPPTPEADCCSVPVEPTATSSPTVQESNQLTPESYHTPTNSDLPISNSDPPSPGSGLTLQSFYQNSAATADGSCQTPAPLPFPITSTLQALHPKSAAVPSLPPGPFPGSSLLPIQPLNLSPKCKDELLRLLSNLSTTESEPQRELCQLSPLPATVASPNLQVPQSPETPLPQLSAIPTPTAPAFTADSPTPSSRPITQQLLKLLLSSPSTISQLNSILGYSVPGPSKSNPLSSTCDQLADNKSAVNPAFMKYLTTLPSYRQTTDTYKY